MVGTNVKAETMSLMDKRSALEAEMNAIIHRLSQPGGAGISGHLVDSEGFPRSDIDIPAVRADRQRLVGLRNEHNDLTEKINVNLQVLHSAQLASQPSPVKKLGYGDGLMNQNSSASTAGAGASLLSHAVPPKDNSSAMDVDAISGIPFAIVDEISEASPAAHDGLQLGDQIVKFGNVESGENLVPRLASEAHTNQGHSIPILVKRQGALMNLTVTPRSWQGRGLLGCHFRIL